MAKICHKCGTKLQKFGRIPTRHGKIQRYRCSNCGRTSY